MAREPVTWYKNHLAGGQTMHWELKDVRFLNDVISLFFLPHCGVCHPAKCFCSVTISLQRTHYSIVNICNGTGEERRWQTLCDKRDNNFV